VPRGAFAAGAAFFFTGAAWGEAFFFGLAQPALYSFFGVGSRSAARRWAGRSLFSGGALPLGMSRP